MGYVIISLMGTLGIGEDQVYTGFLPAS